MTSWRDTSGDGVALALSVGGAAVVGLVSWVLAARVLDPGELGTAAAFVSAVLLVAGCTDLNLGIAVMRWLPRAGGASRTVVLRAAGAVAVMAGVVGFVYVQLPAASLVVDAAAGPGGDRALAVGLFTLTVVLYALLQHQDYVLVGVRRAWWAPARIGLLGVIRVSLLVGLGAGLTTVGVVWSWLVPTTVAVLVGSLVIARALVARTRVDDALYRLPTRREAVAFLGPTYVGKVATAVLYNQVPLLVTFRFGVEPGAAFFVVWQAVTVVDVVALYFVAPLTAAVARHPELADELSRAVRRRLLLLLVPALVVAAGFSWSILGLFGPSYRAAAPVLVLMLAGSACRLLVIHRVGEHQARGRALRYARLAVVNTLLVLGVALVAPAGTPELPGLLLPIAAGFALVQAGCGVVVVLRRRAERPGADLPPGPAPRDGTREQHDRADSDG
ncbi:hypothetical protein [Actinomycetospora aeridis]|uniref:O-antigen/teichoic acid export membrane protein n=1 Tax=Actinomycetospora aeridis TaxID=3129231 RepID=A0ABU8NH64_9PSEU